MKKRDNYIVYLNLLYVMRRLYKRNSLQKKRVSTYLVVHYCYLKNMIIQMKRSCLN